MTKTQKNFFRYICKILGHKRINGVYEGKLLPYCDRCKCDLPIETYRGLNDINKVDNSKR